MKQEPVVCQSSYNVEININNKNKSLAYYKVNRDFQEQVEESIRMMILKNVSDFHKEKEVDQALQETLVQLISSKIINMCSHAYLDGIFEGKSNQDFYKQVQSFIQIE